VGTESAIDPESVDLACPAERIRPVPVEHTVPELLERLAVGRLGRAGEKPGFDSPAFTVRRDRNDLEPDAIPLHVGRCHQDQAARRDMTSLEAFLAAQHEALSVG
jgi:hypothetical protein